jgi:serine/threonine-protein kinase
MICARSERRSPWARRSRSPVERRGLLQEQLRRPRLVAERRRERARRREILLRLAGPADAVAAAPPAAERRRPHEVIALLGPLCAAAAAAHAHGIIHRDIKASNVFLCAEGGGGRRVVLLDFGVAKLLDAEGPKLTGSRQMVGTLACMAPEQILGTDVDERTDVYALGALAYRMLTGEQPFSSRWLVALQQMHLHTAPQPLHLRAPVSPELGAPVLRALSKDRAARQPGPAAFFQELLEAARPHGATQQRPTLGVHVEASADPEVLDDPDERTLADLEGILPAARAALEEAGMKVALETGATLLLSIALPEDPACEAALRRASVDAVIALVRRLEQRPHRRPGVGARVCVHVAPAVLDHDGAVTGGPLLELAAWVPDLAGSALASAAALAGLSASARPAGEACGMPWFDLTR